MSEYQHREAFCLMWYACECGHRERFWERRTALIEMVRRGDAEEFQKGWPMLERAP